MKYFYSKKLFFALVAMTQLFVLAILSGEVISMGGLMLTASGMYLGSQSYSETKGKPDYITQNKEQ